MTVYDSSVLVASLIPAHPEYARCRPHLDRARVEPGAHRCTLHALAETFRVLAAMPIKPALTKQAARTLVTRSLAPHLDPLALRAVDYLAALDLACESPLGAASVSDALHLIAARRAKAE